MLDPIRILLADPFTAGMLGLVAILVGLLTVWIAFRIAAKQNTQMNEIKKIAENLRSYKVKTKNTNEYFKINDRQERQISCLFPAKTTQKPLPDLAEGDYFALHFLGDLIGSKRMELLPVTSSPYLPPEDRSLIFLCSPSANAALKVWYPPLVVEDRKNPPSIEKWLKKDVKLPCWFAEIRQDDIPENERYDDYVREIWHVDVHPREIRSQAEGEYREAFKNFNMAPYKPSQQVVDSAIIFRTSRGEHKIFALCGIHQYGTWIAGEFLRQRLFDEREDQKYNDILFSDDDFTAVVEGKFNSESLQVTSADILDDYLWTKSGDDSWERRRP